MRSDTGRLLCRNDERNSFKAQPFHRVNLLDMNR
jgi:hypothetical protein